MFIWVWLSMSTQTQICLNFLEFRFGHLREWLSGDWGKFNFLIRYNDETYFGQKWHCQHGHLTFSENKFDPSKFHTSHMIKVMVLSIVSFLKDFFSSRFYINHNTDESCNIWCRSVLFWLSYFYWFSGKHKLGCGGIKYWIKWTKWLFSNLRHTSWYVSLIFIFLLFLFRNNNEAVICLSCAIPALFLFLFNCNLCSYKELVLY